MSWLDSWKTELPSGLDDLVSAILDTSYKCGQEFKDTIDEKFGKDSKEARMSCLQVDYEFLFFFAHLSMRIAFSKLGNDKRTKLQDLLGPILEKCTTEAWFGHWPEKLKDGLRNDFYHNMNIAELEYSRCKKLFSEKDESPKDTLFWELGKNIARLSGFEKNPAVILRCLDVSVKNFSNMKLDHLIDSIGKDI